MDLSFLPLNILQAIRNLENINEIRLRVGFPIKCKIRDKFFYLSNNGLALIRDSVICCKKEDINYILAKLTHNSLYAFNDFLRQGFLTWDNGIRIGIAGICVFDHGENLTIKDCSSLVIRIARNIENCSDVIFRHLRNNVKNSLIISPPACGKTTLLKDLAQKLDRLGAYQILIIDERGEFLSVNGENIDKICYSNKLFGLTLGVRSLSPGLIITDELINENDWKCVQNCVNCGLKIIASCHASSITEVKNKDFFINNLFERYFVLKKDGQPGVLDCVYDKSFNKL